MALKILSNSSLQAYNSMRVPAFARRLARVESLGDLRAALDYAKQYKMPVLVLGEGSNILFTKNYPGLVILNRLTGISVVRDEPDSVLIEVASGQGWHDLVCHTLAQDWFGLENLALIPGLVGAAPIQNIGAYGAEIKDTLESVQCMDVHNQELFHLDRQQCQLAYRDSIFKHSLAGQAVIVAVTLKLSKQQHTNLAYPALAANLAQQSNPTAMQVFAAVCAIRGSKLPLPAEIPNCGSFFKNPVISDDQFQRLNAAHPSLVSFVVDGGHKLAAGWLIEQAGWKHKVLDQVAVHPQQALVITNPNHESGATVLRFAETIQADIYEKYGLQLEIEPQLI